MVDDGGQHGTPAPNRAIADDGDRQDVMVDDGRPHGAEDGPLHGATTAGGKVTAIADGMVPTMAGRTVPTNAGRKPRIAGRTVPTMASRTTRRRRILHLLAHGAQEGTTVDGVSS